MNRPDYSADLTALLPRLRRRARRYVGTEAAADDLAQEAMLRVWARLLDDPPIADLDRYLFTAMRNIARRRPAAGEELTEAVMPRTEPVAADRLAAAEVLDALAHLPRAQATLILEHAVDGASHAELARRHGVPLGTVLSRVARGRSELRQRLGLRRRGAVAELLSLRG
ncbi:MAG: RNA polymerase sigma factor [Pseudomonadota bacterium]